MSAQTVIYRKYRPKSFSELQGQDHIKEILTNSLTSKSFSQAYLFAGPRGTGKTSTARLFAKAVNFKDFHKYKDIANEKEYFEGVPEEGHSDIIEIDAASNRKIDDVRLIRDNINFLPTELDYKVYIIDEAHMLTKEAFNALLKTLEEPPSHIIFILATTEPEKLPVTILSRLMRFDFGYVTFEQMKPKLEKILVAEGISFDEESLVTVHQFAQGSFRDAESILNKVVQSGVKELDTNELSNLMGIKDSVEIDSLIKALSNYDYTSSKNILNDLRLKNIAPHRLITELIKMILANIDNSSASIELVKLIKRMSELSRITYELIQLEIYVFCITISKEESKSIMDSAGNSNDLLISSLVVSNNRIGDNNKPIGKEEIRHVDNIDKTEIKDKIVDIAKIHDARVASIISISEVTNKGRICNISIKYKFNYIYMLNNLTADLKNLLCDTIKVDEIKIMYIEDKIHNFSEGELNNKKNEIINNDTNTIRNAKSVSKPVDTNTDIQLESIPKKEEASLNKKNKDNSQIVEDILA